MFNIKNNYNSKIIIINTFILFLLIFSVRSNNYAIQENTVIQENAEYLDNIDNQEIQTSMEEEYLVQEITRITLSSDYSSRGHIDVEIADIDGDGINEILVVWGRYNWHFSIYHYNTVTKELDRIFDSTSGNDHPPGIIVANMDDDAELEIILGDEDGGIHLIDYDVNSETFTDVFRFPEHHSDTNSGLHIEDGVVDINGDGLAEIAFTENPSWGSNNHYLYIYNFDGVNQASLVANFDMYNYKPYGYAGDLDNDNNKELYFIHETSSKIAQIDWDGSKYVKNEISFSRKTQSIIGYQADNWGTGKNMLYIQYEDYSIFEYELVSGTFIEKREVFLENSLLRSFATFVTHGQANWDANSDGKNDLIFTDINNKSLVRIFDKKFTGNSLSDYKEVNTMGHAIIACKDIDNDNLSDFAYISFVPNSYNIDLVIWTMIHEIPVENKDILIYITEDEDKPYNSSYFTELFSTFKSNGYYVDLFGRDTVPILNSSLLSNYAQIWIIDSNNIKTDSILYSFSKDELNAIRTYWYDGGSLALFTDEYTDNWQFGGYFNLTAGLFGVYSHGYSNQGPDYSTPIRPDFSNTELSNGIIEIGGNPDVGNIISNNTQVLPYMYYKGEPILFGLDNSTDSGRLILDETFIRLVNTNSVEGIEKHNNSILALNYAKWLSKKKITDIQTTTDVITETTTTTTDSESGKIITEIKTVFITNINDINETIDIESIQSNAPLLPVSKTWILGIMITMIILVRRRRKNDLFYA